MKTEQGGQAFAGIRKQVEDYVSQWAEDMVNVSLFWRSDDDGEECQKECVMRNMVQGQEIYMRVFSMEEIREEWQKEKDADEMLEYVEQRLLRCRHMQQLDFFRNMSDYEAISSYLVIRPLNWERKRERLEEGLYEKKGNIALVLYFDIGTVGGYYASSMVPAGMLSVWKKEWNDVYRDALENTYRLCGLNYWENCTGILLTAKSACNGAVVIFLPGVAKKMGELLEHDYYVVFISVHEVALHDSSKMDIASIRVAFQDMEECYPAKEDYLTDEIFYYDRERDQFTIAEDR